MDKSFWKLCNQAFGSLREEKYAEALARLNDAEAMLEYALPDIEYLHKRKIHLERMRKYTHGLIAINKDSCEEGNEDCQRGITSRNLLGAHPDIRQITTNDKLYLNVHEKIGHAWNQVSLNPGVRINWWQVPAIVTHINRRVCGESVSGFSQGLFNLLRNYVNNKTFECGISIGCGEAEKEMILMRQGVVKYFDLFEYSDVRIAKGMESARALGLLDRIAFHKSDVFNNPVNKRYDFVHWNNSLHHMFDVPTAVKFSRSVLKKGGIFYMDDFVGPSRFQWSDMVLSVVSIVRRKILAMLLLDAHSSLPFTEKIDRPDPVIDLAYDPSEAADSDQIIPSIKENFPSAIIIPTGGVIYQLALQGVLEHINRDEASEVLKYALEEDDKCIEAGLTHYAVALARKV